MGARERSGRYQLSPSGAQLGPSRARSSSSGAQSLKSIFWEEKRQDFSKGEREERWR
jgi:hypothetical protein